MWKCACVSHWPHHGGVLCDHCFQINNKINSDLMSITGEVLAQSPEPESRDKVLDNRDRTGIWKCWFLRRGETRGNRRKTSRRKDENQQQTQPTYDAESGNRTRATLVGGEYSHHCANPAPLMVHFLTLSVNMRIIALRVFEIFSCKAP